MQLKPNYVKGRKIENLKLLQNGLKSFSYFLGPQAAQVYGFPESDGADISIGIISFGGYFFQSDLDAYFAANSLGTAPSINIAYVGGATQNYSDPYSAS